MKDILKLIMGEFWERPLPKVVTREVDLPSIPGKIPAVIGMRRCGKTWFMFQCIQELLRKQVPLERILYVNFADERLLPIDGKGLGQLVDNFYSIYPENHRHNCFLFLDEIQEVTNWSYVIRRLLDQKKLKMYITGSSAKLLSTEIATELRGRSIAVEMWPYNVNEFFRARGQELPRGIQGSAGRDQWIRDLKEYLTIGGFPEVTNLERPFRIRVLQDYVNTVIFRDIVERYRITNLVVIRQLIRTILQSPGSHFSVNKFVNSMKSQGLKVSKNTVHEYLGYIVDSYLAFTVPLFTESIRKRNTNPRKIYPIDTGLALVHSFRLDSEWGHLLESLVYLDLRRDGYKIYYYISKSGFEVDFVARGLGGELRLIQVAADVTDEKTYYREVRAIREAEKELKLQGELITLENYYRFIQGETCFITE